MTARRLGRMTFQFFLLLAFWLFLSGKFEALYVILGTLSAACVTFLTGDLFRTREAHAREGRVRWRFLLTSGWRFLCYIGWLLFRIIMANFQVAYFVLHPKMPIQPGLLRFKTRLKSDVGHIVLANSITLTPGTITVDLKEGVYLVHALVPAAADSLLEAKMQNKLEAIFGEREEPVPEIRWVDHDGGL